jgi:hypothetical protein
MRAHFAPSFLFTLTRERAYMAHINDDIRLWDRGTILFALGKLWENSNIDTAQRAANIYYRMCNRFVTETYVRVAK